MFASYPVAFGSEPAGHKEKEGDDRTPEGIYIIDFKKEIQPITKHFISHIRIPRTLSKLKSVMFLLAKIS